MTDVIDKAYILTVIKNDFPKMESDIQKIWDVASEKTRRYIINCVEYYTSGRASYIEQHMRLQSVIDEYKDRI